MTRQKITIKGVSEGTVKVIGRDSVIGTGKLSDLADYWKNKNLVDRNRSEMSDQGPDIEIEDIKGFVEVVGRDDVKLESSVISDALTLLQSILTKSDQLNDEEWRLSSEQMAILQEYAQKQKPTLRERAQEAVETIKTIIVAAQLAGPWMSQAFELLRGIASQLNLPIPN